MAGPYEAARRLVALEKEKMLQKAFKANDAPAGSVAAELNALLQDGVINRAQYHDLFFNDQRRSAFEIRLIQALAEEGALCADNPLLFEEVAREGSCYFFKNFSPLAGLFSFSR